MAVCLSCRLDAIAALWKSNDLIIAKKYSRVAFVESNQLLKAPRLVDPPENIKPQVENLARKLGIKQLSDWYYVFKSSFAQHGGSTLLRRFNGSMLKILQEAYPEHTWDEKKLQIKRQLGQKRLESAVHKLFPDTRRVINARKIPDITDPVTRQKLEIDVYVPEFKLAFEYQDKHHYISTWYSGEPLADIQKKDNYKKKIMEEKGFTLIAVPCWWDGELSSLAAVICQRRKDLDLFTQLGLPPGIPFSDTPPEGYFKNAKYYEIPGLGELMLASFFKPGTDPTGWFLFEKYDGIRGLWDPGPKRFFSRQGKILKVRNDFEESMPDLLLDGEIWFGRGQFNETCKISSRSLISKVNWNAFKYMVFDCPVREGTYEERYSFLQTRIPTNHQFVFLAPKITCTGRDHLQEFTKNILAEGGEGVILRNPKSAYEHGRSKNILKFKTFRDLEARVISSSKREDGVTVYSCELPNGLKFECAASGMCDKSLLKPLVIVSCKYNGLYPSGRPREPLIFRPRLDMTWSDVVSQYKETKPRKKTLSDLTVSPIQVSKRQEPGFWTIPSNRRAFLLNFAKVNQFDPAIGENWYKVTKSMLKEAGGKSMISYFKSYRQAIMDTLPELKLDEEQFYLSRGTKKPCEMGYWRNPANCRKFLEDFAKTNNFDHLDLESWKKVKKKHLFDFGANSLFTHHHKTISELLAHAYPEKFTANSIPEPEKKPKLTMSDIRAFFDKLAKKFNFEPLVAENWYPLTYKSVRAEEHGRTILGRYRDCHRSAVAAAYPDVKIDVEKFHGYLARKDARPAGFWKERENCRSFFNSFALAMNFDPLLPANWANLTPEIFAARGRSILDHFEGDLRKALTFAYPEMKF
eukprot:Phypoly_transcript_02692.p1 GENE.Phypoly_transcript_02692~~Phypoly_transcript_02692.p1  ORF type:complete len:862 (+),score=102.64 Phypoly_transcript_02692:87-2672(+)